uniref:PC312R n=1 Tax=African swine fever virus TaxID=10497 RepID=A0A6G7KTU9_ASF
MFSYKHCNKRKQKKIFLLYFLYIGIYYAQRSVLHRLYMLRSMSYYKAKKLRYCLSFKMQNMYEPFLPVPMQRLYGCMLQIQSFWCKNVSGIPVCSSTNTKSRRRWKMLVLLLQRMCRVQKYTPATKKNLCCFKLLYCYKKPLQMLCKKVLQPCKRNMLYNYFKEKFLLPRLQTQIYLCRILSHAFVLQSIPVQIYYHQYYLLQVCPLPYRMVQQALQSYKMQTALWPIRILFICLLYRILYMLASLSLHLFASAIWAFHFRFAWRWELYKFLQKILGLLWTPFIPQTIFQLLLFRLLLL